jgi:putative addiction module component (TIGR02574 family)
MSTLQEITAAALKLTPDEQDALIAALYDSFEPDPEIERAWVKEAVRRADEIESGAVQGISWEESTVRLREKFPWLP